VRRNLNTDTPLPPDEPAAENPPDGAVIDYYLARPASGPVTLEILDAGGHLVRRYESTDPPEATEEELRKTASVPLYWIRMPRSLPGDAGAHRWVWDLHYASPRTEHYDYPISAIPHDTPRYPLGPVALPGRYSVRLQAGGKTQSAPLTIKMDPRVKATPDALERKFRAESRLVSLMNASFDAIAEARPLGEDLAKLVKEQGSGPLGDPLRDLANKVDALLGATAGYFDPVAPKPTLRRLTGDLGTLYGQVSGVDAAPTRSQAAALEGLERDASAVSHQWNAIKSVDLPAMNRQLAGANLPALKIESRPAPVTESENQE
jgi:hypothetical protein